MTERDFCYWLQGFFEVSGSNGGLTKEQAEMIRAHLKLVFATEQGEGVSEALKKIPRAKEKAPPAGKDTRSKVAKILDAVPVVDDPIYWLPSTPNYWRGGGQVYC